MHPLDSGVDASTHCAIDSVSASRWLLAKVLAYFKHFGKQPDWPLITPSSQSLKL